MATASICRLAAIFILWSFAGLALAQDRLQEGRSLVDWYFFDVDAPGPRHGAGELFSVPLAAHTASAASQHFGAPNRRTDVPATKTTATRAETGWPTGPAAAAGRCYLHGLQTWGACVPFGRCAWAQREAAAWRRVEMCADDDSLVCCPEAEVRVEQPALPAQQPTLEDALEFPSSPSWDPYTYSYYPGAGCGHPHHQQQQQQQAQPMQQGYWNGPELSSLPPRFGSQPAPAAPPVPRPQAPQQPMMPMRPSNTMPRPEQPMMLMRPSNTMPRPEQPMMPMRPSNTMPRPEQPMMPMRPSNTMPRPEQPMMPMRPSNTMPRPEQRPMQTRPDLVPWIAEDNKLNASEPTAPAEPAVLDTLPFQSVRRPGDLARQKCIAYEKWAPKVRYGPDKDCVPNHSYPIGGNPAVPNEFPHMAHLGVGRQNSIQWFCGGSLIAPTWVLTAAHCLYSADRQVQWVRLGDQEPDTDKEEYNPQIIAVKQIVRHPEYRALQAYNDIGLLRLAREPDMTPPYVRPACLQVDKELKKDKLNLIGFGLTEENGDPAPVLMEVAIYRTPYEKCKRFFEGAVNVRMLPRGLDDDSQLCAGLDQVGKDACQGDSGGPLNTPYSPTCMLYVAGITSFGQGCGRGAPGVYTRVSHFVPWIESVVWPGE